MFCKSIFNLFQEWSNLTCQENLLRYRDTPQIYLELKKLSPLLKQLMLQERRPSSELHRRSFCVSLRPFCVSLPKKTKRGRRGFSTTPSSTSTFSTGHRRRRGGFRRSEAAATTTTTMSTNFLICCRTWVMSAKICSTPRSWSTSTPTSATNDDNDVAMNKTSSTRSRCHKFFGMSIRLMRLKAKMLKTTKTVTRTKMMTVLIVTVKQSGMVKKHSGKI